MPTMLHDQPVQVDEYLGFTIYSVSDRFIAEPDGWVGQIIEAESLPMIRQKIWRWWHSV